MGKMGNVNADEATRVTAITVDVETGGAVVETVSAVTVKGVGTLCAVVVSPCSARLCCVLPFPVSFLHAWCVSLSACLSRIVGARGVLRVFPGGLVSCRRIRGGLLCAWRTRFREVCAHLLPPVCGVGVGFCWRVPELFDCTIVRQSAICFHGRGGALHPGGVVTYE